MTLYHSAKGSVNYNVVGTLNIVDNVASGFSGSNYLQSSSTFPASTATSLVFSTKFKATSLDSTNCIVSSTSSTIPFHLGLRPDGKIRLYPGRENTSKDTSYVFSINTEYWIRLLWDSSGWAFQYSTDGITYTTDFENYSPSDSSPKSNYVVIGRNFPSGGSEGFSGTIDLNKTYITVNGQPWFGVCPIEVKKHQLMGPVGYTVVGSPTIVDNVASGFSLNDYIRTSQQNALGLNYQIMTSFAVDEFTKYHCIVGAPYNDTNSSNWSIQSGTNSKIEYWLPNDADGSIKKAVGSHTLEANKKYYLNISCIEGAFVSKISEDGITFEQDASFTQTYGIATNYVYFGSKNHSGLVFDGSIDLNNTYIKVNGKLWFYQPAPTKYIVKDDKLVFADQGLYLTGPVNYEVVGSPTIIDGVAGGWSVDDYIKTNSTCDQRAISELVVKIKVPASQLNTSEWKGILSQNFSLNLYSSSANYFIVNLNVNGMSTLTFSNLLPDVWCWLKYTNDGTTGRFYYSYDGVNYTMVSEVDSSSISQQNNAAVTFGLRWGEQPFPGFIDLNETYIKVNGSLWFYGKNYATKNIAPVPAGYTYGTTTTSAIGYVDMRTQAFTAAPTGATIGRDE